MTCPAEGSAVTAQPGAVDVAAARGSGAGEFRRGWHIVLAAMAGSGLGVSGLLTYTSGLFVHDLQREIGLTRGLFGTVFFATTLAMALVLPTCGRLVDRRGILLPAVSGSLALALGFVALGLLTHSLAAYAAIMIAIGLLAVGSTPVAYTRVVSAAFERSRGLALGLTQVGIGIAAALVPPLVGLVIARYGWQGGYYLLAVLALLGVLPALLILRGLPVSRPSPAAADPAAFAAVRRSRTFILQFAAVVTMAVAFAGLLPHFVPMLVDAGLEPTTAAALAGLIGVSVIVSRIVIGWLADRVNAPLLAAGACAICALGLLTIAVGGREAAPVAAVALGVAMGAEADLVGYLTARYFGILVYGRAYGLQYAGFIVAAGTGPMWVGFLADATGSYRAACFIAAGLLCVAIVLFLLLPSTRPRESPA